MSCLLGPGLVAAVTLVPVRAYHRSERGAFVLALRGSHTNACVVTPMNAMIRDADRERTMISRSRCELPCGSRGAG